MLFQTALELFDEGLLLDLGVELLLMHHIEIQWKLIEYLLCIGQHVDCIHGDLK